jgi:hypothetical protein
MNIAVREPNVDQATRLAIVDCDIHPNLRATSDLKPYLSARWQHHLESYGRHIRQALSETLAYPRITPDVARRDAWPPNGGPPGSDLAFIASSISTRTALRSASRCRYAPAPAASAISNTVLHWRAQ